MVKDNERFQKIFIDTEEVPLSNTKILSIAPDDIPCSALGLVGCRIRWNIAHKLLDSLKLQNQLSEYSSQFISFLFALPPILHRSMSSEDGHTNHLRFWNHLLKDLVVTTTTSNAIATKGKNCVGHWPQERSRHNIAILIS